MQESQSEEIILRKAKTHKGRKILSAKESKLEEGIRKTIFLKATKTSEVVSKLCHEMVVFCPNIL